MTLQVRHTSPNKVRAITTLVALFALVAQPMYGLVASQVASALESSNTVYVSKGGSDDTDDGYDIDTPFATIQEAVSSNDTQPGSIISVEEGVYDESVLVDKKVHITSAVKHQATVTGQSDCLSEVDDGAGSDVD